MLVFCLSFIVSRFIGCIIIMHARHRTKEKNNKPEQNAVDKTFTGQLWSTQCVVCVLHMHAEVAERRFRNEHSIKFISHIFSANSLLWNAVCVFTHSNAEHMLSCIGVGYWKKKPQQFNWNNLICSSSICSWLRAVTVDRPWSLFGCGTRYSINPCKTFSLLREMNIIHSLYFIFNADHH